MAPLQHPQSSPPMAAHGPQALSFPLPTHGPQALSSPLPTITPGGGELLLLPFYYIL